jgi:hypothetical protein
MCSRCQTLHRVTRSPSVKRKSLTSAWRRSMSSTRRTRQKQLAAYDWLAAAAAATVAAATAAAVADAAVADAAVPAVAVAAAASVAAVHLGVLAASAKLNCSPIALTKTDYHGRVRRGRPGQLMLCSQGLFCSLRRFVASDGCLGGGVGKTARDGRMVFQTYPEMRGREPDGETEVTGVYRLHRRSGVAGKVRVMTS